MYNKIQIYWVRWCYTTGKVWLEIQLRLNNWIKLNRFENYLQLNVNQIKQIIEQIDNNGITCAFMYE